MGRIHGTLAPVEKEKKIKNTSIHFLQNLQPRKTKTYLQQPDSKHHPKVHPRASLQGTHPRLSTSPCALEPRSTLYLGRRERPRHVLDRAESAAVQRVLDRSNRQLVLGAEEVLPARGQFAVACCTGDEVLEVQRGEDSDEHALQDLQSLDEARASKKGKGRGGPGAGGGGGGYSLLVREKEEGVACGEERQEDREEGESWREGEGELDAGDVLVAVGIGQYRAFPLFFSLSLCVVSRLDSLHGNAHQGEDGLQKNEVSNSLDGCTF